MTHVTALRLERAEDRLVAGHGFVQPVRNGAKKRHSLAMGRVALQRRGVRLAARPRHKYWALQYARVDRAGSPEFRR